MYLRVLNRLLLSFSSVTSMLSYYASSVGLGECVRPRPFHPAGGNMLDDFIAEFDHWLVDAAPLANHTAERWRHLQNPARVLWMGRGTAAHTLETADSGATIGSRTRGEGLLLREQRGRVEKTESEREYSPSRIHKHRSVNVKMVSLGPSQGWLYCD